MKAIILSGGRGSRLSPLTDKKPKPLVTVGDVEILKSILSRLSAFGISECAVTLGYRGKDIRERLGGECYGVKITYFEESEPLGTAGGVKNAESFIDSDFLVMSGDALTALEIDEAILSHENSKDIATLVLTRTADVSEYGVVLVDGDGKVTGFSEKPAWEGVKSDLVNCGIYVFKKEILSLIPQNTFYDFSTDLFPKILADGGKINTFITRNFWCDVGNPWSLYSCNMKTLSKDFFIRYTPKNVKVHKSARISSSVIGENSIIGANSSLQHSVVGRRCRIGEGVLLTGCIIGDDVTLENGVKVERGAVVGDSSHISSGKCVSEGKKLSADTRLESDDGEYFFSSPSLTVSGSVIVPKSSPETFFAIGRAAVVLNSEIGIFHSHCEESCLAATLASLGVSSSGGEGIIFGEGCMSDAVFCAGKFSMPVLYFSQDKNGTKISVFDSDTLPLSRKREREFLSAAERPPKAESVGRFRYFDGWEILLKQHFLSLLKDPLPSNGKVRIKDNASGELFCSFAKEKTAILSESAGSGFFIEISPDRKEISLTFGKRHLDTVHTHALILKTLISQGRKTFSLPSTSPAAFDTIAKNSGAEILRTCKSVEDKRASAIAFDDLWARDGLFAAALIYKTLELHSFSEEKLGRWVDTLPVFLCIQRELDTGRVSSATIMRRLQGEGISRILPEGIELFSENGGVKITPENKNRLKLFAESVGVEAAEAMCDFAEDIIKSIENS